MRECRLAVRPKGEMMELIQLVLDYYKDRKYIVKGNSRRGTDDQEQCLVIGRTMKKWEENKQHVQKGCLNDPPGKDVYIRKQVCPKVSMTDDMTRLRSYVNRDLPLHPFLSMLYIGGHNS